MVTRMSGKTREARFTLLGVGAMNSPRYKPAGLLVHFLGCRVMLDGGPGSEPDGNVDAHDKGDGCRTTATLRGIRNRRQDVPFANTALGIETLLRSIYLAERSY